MSLTIIKLGVIPFVRISSYNIYCMEVLFVSINYYHNDEKFLERSTAHTILKSCASFRCSLISPILGIFGTLSISSYPSPSQCVPGPFFSFLKSLHGYEAKRVQPDVLIQNQVMQFGQMFLRL